MISTNRIFYSLAFLIILTVSGSHSTKREIDIENVYKLLLDDQLSQKNPLLFTDEFELLNQMQKRLSIGGFESCELSCPAGCKFC